MWDFGLKIGIQDDILEYSSSGFTFQLFRKFTFWEPLLQKNNQSIKIVHKSLVHFIVLT